MTRCARRSSRCVGRRTRRKHQHMSSAESKEERLDRELIELLNELRVALPGVQVLFAFLLGVPFTQRFEQVTELQKDVYCLTFLCAAFATALLTAPSAYHRLEWRRREAARGRRLRRPGAGRRPGKRGLFTRRGRFGHVQQVLDLLDALHLLRPLLEVLDQLGLLDLTPEDDFAVLGVDVDPPLRDVRVTEDLRLDLVRERDVVRLRLLLFLEVGGLLLRGRRLGGDGAAGSSDLPGRVAEERGDPLAGESAAAAPVLRIEEIGEHGPHGHISELANHASPLARWQVRTTLNGQGKTVRPTR